MRFRFRDPFDEARLRAAAWGTFALLLVGILANWPRWTP